MGDVGRIHLTVHYCSARVGEIRGLVVAQLVRFAVDEDASAVVSVEVDDDEVPDDLVLAGRGSDAVERAAVTLQQALDTLRPALVRITELAKSVSPTEASVEIGLKLGGETGLIIAKGTAEANLKLKLVWKA